MAKPGSSRAVKRPKPIASPLATTAKIQKLLLDADTSSKSYPAGSNVFRQGEAAEWIYFIVRGKVQISVLSKQGKEGMIAQPLSDGDFVGESSLSSQHRYLVSADTVVASEIIKIPKVTMASRITRGCQAPGNPEVGDRKASVCRIRFLRVWGARHYRGGGVASNCCKPLKWWF